MASDDVLSGYARALWAVGAFLVLLPIVDVGLRAVPLDVGNMQWRFAFLGLLFTSTGGFILGLAVVGLAAALRRDLKLMRLLSGAAFLSAIVIAVGAVVYVLDALQLQALAPADDRQFVVQTGIASTTAALVGALTLSAIGVAGWRASESAAVTRHSASATPASTLLPLASPGGPEHGRRGPARTKQPT